MSNIQSDELRIYAYNRKAEAAMMKRTGYWSGKQAILLAALVAILLHGCGAGTQSGGSAVCTQDTFTPNYVPNIEHLLRWSSFPVRVYFVKDANYTPEHQQIAEEGFKLWVGATGEVAQYQILDSPERVHIRVKFDPTTKNGFTNYRYYTYSRLLIEATITIGIKDNHRVDIQSVAAHEFGHALGIGGHSPHPADMMYHTFTTGVPLGVTASDLNTFKTAYCSLFTRSNTIGRAEGSISETTIHCGHDH